MANAFEQHTTVDHAGAKILTLWAAVGITSWADAAAAAAFIYSALLIGEFLWKKFLRPFAERRGWLMPRTKRRADDR